MKPAKRKLDPDRPYRANIGASAVMARYGPDVIEALDRWGEFVYAIRTEDGRVEPVDRDTGIGRRLLAYVCSAHHEAEQRVEQARGRQYLAVDTFGERSPEAKQAAEDLTRAKALASAADDDRRKVRRLLDDNGKGRRLAPTGPLTRNSTTTSPVTTPAAPTTPLTGRRR